MALSLFFQRIVTLPVWWYGRGLSMFIQWLSKAFSGFSTSSGLRVWMKNLFVPMYGDTSFTGRAISIGIRLVMIVVRGLGALLFAVLLFCLFVLYLIVLPVSLLGFFYHLLGFFS